MNARARFSRLAAMLGWLACVHAVAGPSDSFDPDTKRCAAVKESAPVPFHGMQLVEIPDIREPQLRLINELVSAGCFDVARERMDSFERLSPGSRNIHYVRARYLWRTEGAPAAQKVLEPVLKQYPDFASAKVLMAGIWFDYGFVDRSAKLLDEAESQSPNDLWIYINRARVQSVTTLPPQMRAAMMEMARDPRFPPNARAGASEVVRSAARTGDDYETGLWLAFETDAPGSGGCKAVELADWFEKGGRYADTIRLLESPRATSGDCLSHDENRVRLAQAYLMEAAKISSGPAPANTKQVKRATELLRGDFNPLARYVVNKPQAATLRPFLLAFAKPNAPDQIESVICYAVTQLDADAVSLQLEAGADPNGLCRGKETLVGWLVVMPVNGDADRRRAVLKTLLEHGARPSKTDVCRASAAKDPNCGRVLLPLLEQYSR